MLAAALMSLTAMLCPVSLHAQTYVVNEGFEGEAFPPAGWTTVDADGDGHCWQIAKRGQATLSGSQIAVSYTVNPSDSKAYAAQDNWLITPQIDVTDAQFKLSFSCCAEDMDSSEKMQVLISETGTDQADFTKVLIDETLDNGYDDVSLQSRTRSLADYAGKKIYIAFRHTGTNTYALGIDDVVITDEKGPKPVTSMTVTPGDNGALSATIAWKNPSTDGTGTALTSFAIGVYRDGTLIKVISDGLTAGETAQYVDAEPTNGTHTYSLIVRADGKESKAVSKSVYVGEDKPASPSGVTVVFKDSLYNISWQAPTTGASKGYINPDNLTYSVYCTTPDKTYQAAHGLKTLSCKDRVNTGVLVKYSVVAKNAAGESEPAYGYEVISYPTDESDINVTPDATAEYANPRLPFDASSKVSASQSIFYPSDLYNATGTISDIVLKNNFRNSNLKKPVKIWLGETDTEDLSAGWMTADNMILVYDDSLSLPQGDNDIPMHLSTPYVYTGKNLVMMAYMGATTGSGAYFDRFYVQTTEGTAVRSRATTSYSDNLDPTSVTGYTSSYQALPAIRFVMKAKGAAKVTGTVTDKADSKPVAGATVAIPELKQTATTDEEGKYEFYLVKSGEQTVTISAPRYNDLTTTITVAEEGAQTNDFQLEQKAQVALTGKAELQGVGAAKGVRVTLSGYTDDETTTDENGQYTINVYSGEQYVVTYSYPLYNSQTDSISCTEATEHDVTLSRALIPAFGAQYALQADGKSVDITWQSPYDRTGKTQWTAVGASETNNSTGGDYYSDDYYVAHAFSADDVEAAQMAGLSFTKMRVYLKATAGTFTASIFKGTKADHTLLAAVDITKDVTAEGGWVTADFGDNAVEIRKGESYLVAVRCQNASSSPVGTAAYGSSVSDKNNLKWSETTTLYNGYYAWNISALCSVPGLDGEYGTPEITLPEYTYSVYRVEETAPEAPTLVADGIPGTQLNTSDKTWGHLSSGKYVYKVVVDYSDELHSLPAQTDTITRMINTDAGVDSIISPAKAQDEQQTVSVKVRVKNYGESPLTSVLVKAYIDEETTLSKLYEGSLSKDETAEVDLGTVELKADTYYNIKAYTELEGDMRTDNDTVALQLPNKPDVNLRAFRWDAYSDAGLMSIHSNIPEQATFVKEVTPEEALLIAGEYYDGKLYGYTASWSGTPKSFVVLDTATWAPSKTVSTTDYVIDMAYDYSSSTMYALAVNDGNTVLATVNTDEGTCSTVATLDASFFTLACTTDGQLYAVSKAGDLCTVDKTTGTSAIVGSTGVTDVMYLQSMAYDHNTGRMFWAHTGSSSNDMGTIYEVDPATGAVLNMGTAMHLGAPAELVALYVPYDDPHLSIGSISGNNGIKAVADRNGNITVTMPTAAPSTICVMDISGKTIATATATAERTVIPASTASGIYIIQVKTADGNTAVMKVTR